MFTERVFAERRTFKEIDMKMRRLLSIALPFMAESRGAAIVIKRELILGALREGDPDHLPGKAPTTAAQAGPGKGLYGLPCARCGLYYAAELAVCPVCNSTERVFPKLKSPAWPASVPQPRAVGVLHEENLGGLATINRELLSKQVQPLTMLTTTEAIPALA
jgi:hypothetical protein